MYRFVTRTRNRQFGHLTTFRAGAAARVVLSSTTVGEGALAGAVIGGLSSSFGVPPRTYSVVSDPDSKFAVSGANLTVRSGASFDFETSTFHLVTIRVTDGTAATSDVPFIIHVSDVNEIPIGASNSATLIVSPGVVPSLTSPTGVKSGTTSASLGVTTDRGSGTIKWVVTTSATKPSVAQMLAGQDHTGAAAPASGSIAVTSAGAKTATTAGLASGTTYYAHYQHRDIIGNDSTVATSTSFSTDSTGSAPTFVAGGQLFNNSTDPTPVLTSTGITLAAGETIVVRIMMRRTAGTGLTMTFDTLTFNGNALTLHVQSMPSANSAKVCTFIASYRSAAGETGPVVMDISPTIDGEAVYAHYDIYSGVNPAAPVGATANLFSNDVTSQQLQITTQFSNSVVLYAFSVDYLTANTSVTLSGATQDANAATGTGNSVDNICVAATEAAATIATYDATVTNAGAAKVASCAIELRAP